MTSVSKYGRGWWLLSSLNGGSGGLGSGDGIGLDRETRARVARVREGDSDCSVPGGWPDGPSQQREGGLKAWRFQVLPRHRRRHLWATS